MNKINWRAAKVKELIEEEVIEKPLDGNHGNLHPKSSDFVSKGIPFIMASDLVNGEVDLVNCKFIKQSQADSLQKGFSYTGDVLLSHKGSIGKTAIVRNIDTPYIMLTPQVTYYRIKDTKRLNNAYLKYYFDGNYFQGTLNSWAGSGATRAYLGITEQQNLPIVLPPIEIQKKIASILSSYDDLIENNNRRIKILEEMAQTIYNEWFIKFRFPGQSKVKMVNSELGEIPEGWEIGRLGDVADIEWGDLSITKKSYVSEGYDAYSASGLDGKRETFDFDRDGIVLSAIGANCGKTWYAKGKWSCIKNTIRFWAKSSSVTNPYLYFVTQKTDFWVKRGAAQPFVSLGDARSSKVIIPDSKTLEEFSGVSSLCLNQINILQIKNINLCKTRDILLPRLISGELDVENLVIKVDN